MTRVITIGGFLGDYQCFGHALPVNLTLTVMWTLGLKRFSSHLISLVNLTVSCEPQVFKRFSSHLISKSQSRTLLKSLSSSMNGLLPKSSRKELAVRILQQNPSRFMVIQQFHLTWAPSFAYSKASSLSSFNPQSWLLIMDLDLFFDGPKSLHQEITFTLTLSLI